MKNKPTVFQNETTFQNDISRFRKAKVEDANAIIEFQLAMAWETEKLNLDRTVLSSGVKAVFATPEIGEYYVCQIGDRVVGAMMITKEWSDWRNGSVWWIQSLYFLPEYRGQKLYSGLYEYIRNLVQADSTARGIRLYVDHSNIAAQKVYTKHGMNGDHYKLFEWMK